MDRRMLAVGVREEPTRGGVRAGRPDARRFRRRWEGSSFGGRCRQGVVAARLWTAIALGALAWAVAVGTAGAVVTYPVDSGGNDLKACDDDHCCTATSDLGAQVPLQTGYDGWIGFNHHWSWQRDFASNWWAHFQIEIDGATVLDTIRYGTGGGTLTSLYHCSSGEEGFGLDLRVWVYRSGNLKCQSE